MAAAAAGAGDDDDDARLMAALRDDMIAKGTPGSFLSSDLVEHLEAWRAKGKTPFLYLPFEHVFTLVSEERVVPPALAHTYFFLRGFRNAAKAVPGLKFRGPRPSDRDAAAGGDADAEAEAVTTPVKQPRPDAGGDEKTDSPWGSDIGARARKKQALVGTLKPHEVERFLRAHGVATIDEYFAKYDPDTFQTAYEQFQETGKVQEQRTRPEEPTAVWEGSAEPFTDKELTRTLMVLSLVVSIDGEGRVVLLRKTEPLSTREVAALIHDVEYLFCAPGVFQFSYIVHRVVQGCREVMERHVPELPVGAIADVEVRYNTCGDDEEDFMVPFAISFEANMAQREVSMPNPYDLSAAHLKLLMKRSFARNVGEMYLLFYHTCLRVPCHEFVHLVQHLVGQLDGSPLSWSAEHDASFLSHSLFHQVAQLASMQDLFHDGVADEALAVANMRANAMVLRWSEERRAAYVAWRDAFGLRAPDLAGGEDTGIAAQFKSVIGCEGFKKDLDLFKQQVQLVFDPNRCNGSVYRHEIRIPQGLASLVPIGGLPPRATLVVPALSEDAEPNAHAVGDGGKWSDSSRTSGGGGGIGGMGAIVGVGVAALVALVWMKQRSGPQ